MGLRGEKHICWVQSHVDNHALLLKHVTVWKRLMEINTKSILKKPKKSETQKNNGMD